MKKREWQTLALFVLLVSMAMLSACGSGSSATSGTLSVDDITNTDLTGGIYSVSTSATYAPSTGTALPNTEISYVASFAGGTTTTRSGKLSSNDTGKVFIGPWQITQDTVPIIVTINVTTGGLSSTKIASIPAISPLTVNPAAFGFKLTDTAGTPATVAVTGGFSPYTVSSAAPIDISAAVSGGTVTITKLTAAGPSNTSTDITITDNKGNKQIVVVGYYR